MSIETTEVLVVGAGQAGVAMSEHLGKAGIPHIVLERSRIAERWRSERWDSLRANGPAWHDRFPGLEFSRSGPDAFPGKEEVAAYFEEYARQINAPIRCGVTVEEVRRHEGRPGFRVTTSQGEIDARCVVAATGPFQKPIVPDLVPETPGITQMHSTAYRNPGQLAEGAVLVVGAGSSGTQIAEELMRSGRQVYLSVGPHHRPPRSYRGRDFCWWLGVLNKWDTEATPGVEHTTIAVSGANGGHTIDFRRLAHGGMTLVGRTQTCDSGVIGFASDLVTNIAAGDANYLSLLDEADAFVERNGLDLPEEPDARRMEEDPACLKDPLTSLDLAKANVTTIIWATGFVADYSWLQVDAVDDNGRPDHQRGVSAEPGVYFLGLPWQTRRGSSFIWGVWCDARYITEHIVKQRGYLAYRGPADAQQETEHA
ncbi:putative flavoprotein involved in K+ transport [Sagittula marina]|uniref:Putative flavoprotein involved in K+ transport n=1 Tax=Sagittula marina TaxID=943940 RepID=A0A7W6DJF3_9RHOB|nr:NAD(P)/FAD-dependent oxidoreductase [Sagittula marina]MBB3984370.1 putative flavoprotein involved in K+ transport [Sagittula marina]